MVLHKARVAAIQYLAARGYIAEANAIRNGQGDDFAEVRIALSLLREADARTVRLERALAIYADADFWIDNPAPSDAMVDGGMIARHALAGTTPAGRYHD